MADQPPNEDESFTTDNVSTRAKISIDNDVPENLHAFPDGVTQSAPAVALESPYEEHDRRSSTISHRREDTSVTAAADVAPTVAGAAVGATFEREIYQYELAQSLADNARLARTADRRA